MLKFTEHKGDDDIRMLSRCGKTASVNNEIVIHLLLKFLRLNSRKYFRKEHELRCGEKKLPKKYHKSKM